MPEPATPLPCRRSELVVRPFGEQGRYVVKDPQSGAYFQIGDEEHFLLSQLDGQRDAGAVRSAYAERFNSPLAEEDLHEFLEQAESQGFLQGDDAAAPATNLLTRQPATHPNARAADYSTTFGSPPLGLRLLFWRKSLFDPDRLFSWLAPKIGFFGRAPFSILSAGSIVAAVVVLWMNRYELAGSIVGALRWETALLAWLALMVVLTCHEFAHGLTCKRYGGEVHEVGFLLIFFMPCFYCNVSDAWLFKEKSKRLWVTFAGGYFELFLWALAVFVWRLASPDSLIHYLAFVVVSACGVQTLFNFNPLLKLDGYYLLSDGLEIPNLQQRAGDYLKAWIRSLLWGAARPEPEPRSRAFLFYGLVSWLYSLTFLGITLFVLSRFLGGRWGLFGLGLTALLALLCLRGLFLGFTAGEARTMILTRYKRTTMWALILLGAPIALFHIPMEDRAGGSFRLRPATRAELRAPIAGFLKEIGYDEGDRVSPGYVVARLEAPDLASRLAQKQAEAAEIQAKLRLLTVGARPEEIAEQRLRTNRAQGWRDLARQDLKRIQRAFDEDLDRLDKKIAVARAELDVALDGYQRAKTLVGRGAQPEEQLHEVHGKYRVAEARLAESQAAKRAQEAKGTLEAEAELARREKELADAQAVLRLLEAGTRPEEVQAEQAHWARLQEEVRRLEELRSLQTISSPVTGLITTARLKEKIGQYLREGDLICTVEDSDTLEAEINLTEQDVARVRLGQCIQLKARAVPFETFTAQVERIAPAAGRGDVQSTVIVCCRLPVDQTSAALRSEMTGYARIDTGRRSVGAIAVERVVRFLRTEFWW